MIHDNQACPLLPLLHIGQGYVARERQRAWDEVQVKAEAFDMLHPGGRQLEVKMCVQDIPRHELEE